MALLAVGHGAALADFTGRVVRIVDADTLDVLANQTPIRVRLDSIDAPERGRWLQAKELPGAFEVPTG
jgi:endonuclease YncB( thermonuclease family)